MQIVQVQSRFIKGNHVTHDGVKLEWARFTTNSPRALIFIPPLIGGNFAQQMRLFRWFTRLGMDILSFNYAGHGGSTGKFSIRESLRNTQEMLFLAQGQARAEKIPMMGIGACYSSIPLIFASHHLNEPLERLALINPLTELYPWAVLRSFARYYQRFFLFRKQRVHLKRALMEYIDFLFPDVAKQPEAFGVLERGRIHPWKILFDFFLSRPLRGITLKNTPVLCLYARRDRVLGTLEHRGKHHLSYESKIRNICPKTLFQTVDSDHFFSSPEAKKTARRAIAIFFAREDKPAKISPRSS